MACNAVHAVDITISEESRTDGMALVTQEDGAAPFVIDAADAEVWQLPHRRYAVTLRR